MLTARLLRECLIAKRERFRIRTINLFWLFKKNNDIKLSCEEHQCCSCSMPCISSCRSCYFSSPSNMPYLNCSFHNPFPTLARDTVPLAKISLYNITRFRYFILAHIQCCKWYSKNASVMYQNTSFHFPVPIMLSFTSWYLTTCQLSFVRCYSYWILLHNTLQCGYYVKYLQLKLDQIRSDQIRSDGRYN